LGVYYNVQRNENKHWNSACPREEEEEEDLFVFNDTVENKAPFEYDPCN
jgi:hypothetical protein